MDPHPGIAQVAAERDAFFLRHQRQLTETAEEWAALPIHPRQVYLRGPTPGLQLIEGVLHELQTLVTPWWASPEPAVNLLLRMEVDRFLAETRYIFCDLLQHPVWYIQVTSRARYIFLETLHDVHRFLTMRQSALERLISVVCPRSSCEYTVTVD